MSNDYFESTSLTRNTTAKAEDINTRTESIEAGFTKLPAPHASAPTTKGFSETFTVEDATARDEPPSAGQIQDQDVLYAADSGSANTYAVTLAPAVTAYAAGMRVVMKAANANTGASTINVNAIGAVAIKKFGGTSLAGGEIVADAIVSLTYDGTNFQLDSWTTVAAPLLDEDDMASDSSTAAATQQSIKAYVDNDVKTVAQGGTGVSTLTDHGVMIGSGVSAVTSAVAGTDGQLLIGSTGADPVFATLTADDGLEITAGAGTLEIDLDLKANGGAVIESNELAIDLGASNITGTLAVGDGGTGAATLTDHGIILGSGTAAVTALGAATNGQLPIGSTGADPTLATLTAGEAIDITNAAGSITVACEDATVDNKGVAELATDAETVTGTDTGRAVTPANVKAKMSAPGPIGDTTPNTGAFTSVSAGTIDATGRIASDVAGNATSFKTTAQSSYAGYFAVDNASYDNYITQLDADRTASEDFDYLRCYNRNSSDTECKIKGDGNATIDGSWTGGGADYAEFFEWLDGNPGGEDRRGISVVVEGGQIRPAGVAEEPDGVVSARPVVVGDAADLRWSGKYLRDDYGVHLTAPRPAIRWADGKREHCYMTDRIPNDVMVPDDAETIQIESRILNPDYDPDAEYIPRESRPEWSPVGLMGKLRIRTGQPVGSRWKKMRDIAPGVEEWLVK